MEGWASGLEGVPLRTLRTTPDNSGHLRTLLGVGVEGPCGRPIGYLALGDTKGYPQEQNPGLPWPGVTPTHTYYYYP